MNTDKKSRTYHIMTAVILAAWILFIFSNSLQNGTESSSKSGAVLAFIQSILGTDSIITELMIRKLAHFTEFAIVGVLFVLVLRGYTMRLFRYWSVPLLGGLMTALTDETIQLFSDGRAGMVADVWIDFSGVVTGSLLMILILNTLRYKQLEAIVNKQQMAEKGICR